MINGQLGTVFKVSYNSDGNLQTIYIKFDDNEAGLQRMRRDQYATQHNVVPINKIEMNVPVNTSSINPCIIRTRFPLMLAWACTAHKVQGLTVNNTVVSFELNKQRRFSYGQIYVALSRVRNLSNLFIKGKATREVLVANPEVSEEYERLRTECAIPLDTPKQTSKFAITLLNIRSLRKHYIDLSNDRFITQSNIICLIETQLSNNMSNDSLQMNFQNHDVLLHNNVDKFKSLALLKNTFIECCVQLFDRILYGELIAESFHDSKQFSILLLYKSNNANLRQFTKYVSQLVHTLKPDIVLGDFNLNAFSLQLCQLSTNLAQMHYILAVNEPTHISGGLIDHIYLSKCFHEKFNIAVNMLPVYYSDHHAVTL